MGSSVNYVWNEAKNRRNFRKHGIAFEEACQIFDDPNILSFYDLRHSSPVETRWCSMGCVRKGTVCVVIHLAFELDEEEVIRVISARTATRNELMQYYSQ